MLHFSLTAGNAKEQMNYILMPSLEHRALTKIAITLWNPDDIQLDDIQLEDIYFHWKLNKWTAEDHVIGKVKELPLPESLKKKISGFIKPIGFEILAWINHYQNILSCDDGNVFPRKSILDFKKVGKSLSNLCWTPQGTVDRKKTAEKLIRDENLDITERYKLACVSCLKNDILKLWNKMPKDLKNKFYNEEDPRHVNQDPLVVLWTYDIKGEVSRMHHMFEEIWHRCTPYQYAFHCAVYSGDNKEATEYFLQKLTSEEKEKSLARSAFPNKDTLCYLLSQMNEVQQVRMLRKYPLSVLNCLLDRPLQGLFMEMAKHMWDFLPVWEYLILLEEIIAKVKAGYKDYDYRKIFREFWQQSPLTHKEFVIDDCPSGYLLLDLLHIKDKEYLKLILGDATTREKIIFSDGGKNICVILFENGEMDLLEFFVQECIPSKDVMIKFRKEFEETVNSEDRLTLCLSDEELELEKDMFSKLLQLLNDFIQKYDKRRCVEEGNNGPVKRLCNLTSE